MPVSDWLLACPDWEARLRDGRSLVPDLPLDEAAAARGAATFDMLHLPDVPGQPALAEAAGDWFRSIVRAVCGSIDAQTGRRRVGEVFILVPKKNSKTTNSAALGLTLMLMNTRPNADMLIVGPTQAVAELCFEQAVGMINADPEGYLQKRFHVQTHRKTITCRLSNASLRIRSFSADVMTGQKPSVAIVDELHVMSAHGHASGVIGQVRGGLMANPESVLVFITTQSERPPAGVFRAELTYAREVRDGRHPDARTLPVLYEFPESIQSDDLAPWRDESLWPMVLPNLGRSITIERLRDDFAVARSKGADEERRWASQHLNIQIGIALHSDRWIGADYWLGAAEPMSLDELIARSDVCVAGIDGGGLDDLLGLAVIGRDRVNRVWRIWAHAWAQPEALQKRKEIAPSLRDFRADGDLTICATSTQDIVDVADIVERLADARLLPEAAAVGLDPYGVGALVDELAARGLSDAQLVGIGQGSRLSPAIWTLERKLKDGTATHCGQRLMTWCVGNARVEQRGNAVLITKQTAGKSKIDPLVATLNAVMLMAKNPVSGGNDSYLSRRELVVL